VTAVARPTPLPISFAGPDDRLLEALVARRPAAWLAFYDRFAPYVASVLRRLVGLDAELEDLVQEVFARALEGVGRVQHSDRLKAWLRSLTVFTARATLKRRRWRTWVGWAAPEPDVGELAEPPVAAELLEERRALRRVQAILAQLAVDDRIAFNLRYLEGLELTEVAETCQVSLSTAKRRIWRAEAHFGRAVSAEPELERWIAEGRSRWRGATDPSGADPDSNSPERPS
jgi:RNA polymerase sigma-70 factor, ECF subfamily